MLSLLLFTLLGADAPPGVVVHYQPASTGMYVGSPGIAVLPDGSYIAKMDLFGPKSTEKTRAVTKVFRSRDRGATWSPVKDIDGMYWASVFVHRKALYLMGPEKQYGNLMLMRSTDGGATWQSVLLAEGKFHCAPVPVVVHRGRIWRAVEDGAGPGGWGSHFRAYVISAPEKSDLMNAKNWSLSNPIGRDPQWLNGDFLGWLEGNVVVDPTGNVVNVLRVDTPKVEKAAIIRAQGTQITFDPTTGFIDMPGGAKKFTIRWDKKSKLYWSLVNVVKPEFVGPKPASVRNTLALATSPDLRSWTVRKVILEHPEVKRHAFQYVDWLFEKDDLIVASRTAFDDAEGGAHNAHDANYLTFHRIAGFRNLR
ncbi:MAG: hypothetical protein MUC42_14015 [Bryobacter sp.]|nr:hypothetical protein [Bryobacter sp.]